MNEIVKAVNAVPASVDSKIEPLNNRLATVVSAIESFSRTSENIEKIREEFTGFRSFREHIEGYEKEIKAYLKRAFWWVLGLVVSAICSAYYFGLTMSAIGVNVGEMKDSVEKLQALTYELNGTTKGQGERLKSMDEQLKAMQVSVRETARTVAETSDKASVRIARAVDAFEEHAGKNNVDLSSKIDAIERKLEEISDVVVLSFILTPETKPDFKSDTRLTYEMRVPPQQRRSAGSKAFQAGAVSFFDGDVFFRPVGVMATAYPKREDTVGIDLAFQDKSALEAFMKRLGERRSIRLKITFSLG